MASIDVREKNTERLDPTLLARVKASPDQIDNLLRFINRAETPEDLSCAFGDGLGERVAESGQAILDVRDETGGFFGVEDLVRLETVVGDDLPALLTAARYPLLSSPPTPRFAAVSFAETPLLVAGFVGVPVLFAIAWEREPAGWVRFIRFGIALSDKRLGLSIEEAELEGRVKKAQERIARAQADRAAAMGETPPDQQVIDQSNAVIAANQARVANNSAELARVRREAQALNDAVKKADLVATRAIVEGNLNERAAELDALANAARRRGEAAADRGDRRAQAKAQADERRYLDELGDIGEDLAAIARELG